MNPPAVWTADIIARDREDRPVLLAEVKSLGAGADAILQVITALKASDPPIPFGMVADPHEILIFSRECEDPSKALLSLPTAEILREYEPEFGTRRIFQDYFAGLVEAWLRDLAYHWKSEAPPASDRLAAVGLLEALTGGSTVREARLRDRSLFGN